MSMTFSYDDGVLAITAPRGQMRLRWQPTPLAEELIPGARTWQEFFPAFRIIEPVAAPLAGQGPSAIPTAAEARAGSAKAAAFHAFRQLVPAAVVDAVAEFRSHQWLLMLLLASQPAVFDLVATNPVLAYCLANNDQLRGTQPAVSLALALGHCRQKQRTQLEWLGFPGTEAAARMLRRVPVATAAPALLWRLGRAIGDEPGIVHRLAHVPVLNAGVLELMVRADLRALVTPRLLLAIAARHEETHVARTADQLAAALALRHAIGAAPARAPFGSVAQILRFQEQADLDYQAHLRQQAEARAAAQRRLDRQVAARREQLLRQSVRPSARAPYPPPPVPGTPSIIPIASAAELRREGDAQCNCVASYLPNVLSGACYFYRVTAPERATLAIVPTYDGGWRRSELKGRLNGPVRPATNQAVDGWLQQHRLSAGA